MDYWPIAIMAPVASYVVVTWIVRPKRDGQSTFDLERGVVEVTVPHGSVVRLRVTAAGVLLLPLLPIHNPHPGARTAVACLAALCSSVLLWTAALLSRRFVFSEEGIAVVGALGWRIPWSEVAEIRAISSGTLLFVPRTGRRVGVIRSFNGWNDLMEHLERLASAGSPEAGRKAVAALSELKRWKRADEQP